MVIVDLLRISDDGKEMYLSCHVNKADYYENVYLDSITIMTADKVSDVAPELYTEDYVYRYEIAGEEKEIEMVLKPTDFNEKFTKSNFSSDLFFVYIHCKGIPDPCTPCGEDRMTTVAVTFDTALLYQQVMQYTRELNEDCNIPMSFIDLTLLWNGFKAAVETEHWIPAIDFYNKMFGGYGMASYKTKPCGCHG